MKSLSSLPPSFLRVNLSPALAESKTKNWTDHTRGLGKQVWKKIDVRRYINDLRNEWENYFHSLWHRGVFNQR